MRLETVKFLRASRHALECNASLMNQMYKDDWSWSGQCDECQRHFAPGLPDGTCEHSQPKPFAGIAFRNDNELARMMGELGGVSLLIYIEETKWKSEPRSKAALAEEKESRDLCPRCRAIDAWRWKWEENLMERLSRVAHQIANGQTDPDVCLAELPQEGRRDEYAAADLLFSNRVRSIVHQLRGSIGPGGSGGLVAIIVPTAIICHVLCQLLCFLRPVWQRRPESSGTPDEMMQKMMRRPVHEQQACTRYIASLMNQDELERIGRDVRELRVPVVVVCIDANVDIPAGTFGKCTQALCWNNYCGPPYGLLMQGSRLTYMYEDWYDNATSSSWSVQALQAARAACAKPVPSRPATSTSIGAACAKALPSRPATSATTATATLEEDLELDKLSILLEELWLLCAQDSYTVAGLRKRVVRTATDIFLVNYEPSKGYKAMVPSLGQLASPEPRLHSEWHPNLNVAKRDAAEKALDIFSGLGLLNSSKKMILSTAANVATRLETTEQLTPLQSKLVEWHQPQHSVKGFEGPWIKLIDKWPMLDGNQAPYCMLCETWATEQHLTSEEHKQAKRDVEGAVPLVTPPVINRGKPEMQEFASLHACDLSDPKKKWPRILRVLRLEPTITAEAVPSCTEYGILLAQPTAEENEVTYFGLSLEWCRDSACHGAVRLKPVWVDWVDECRKIQESLEEGETTETPEELIRNYHEAMVNQFMPSLRPNAAQIIERLPTAAFLVKLASSRDQNISGRFAWLDMKAVVEEHHKKGLEKLIEHSTDGYEDDEASAPLGSVTPHVVLDVFVEPDAVCMPNVAVNPDYPAWLMSVVHRWHRLNDLELAMRKHVPVFPTVNPLLIEASLLLSSTVVPHDALRALGMKVLATLVAVICHSRYADKYPAQVAQHSTELLPREKLAKYLVAALPPIMLSAAKSKLHLKHWTPPGARCRPQQPSNTQLEVDELAHIAEAFIGAFYLSEGSFFSAHQFIEWLQTFGGERDKSEPWEKAVLGHLFTSEEIFQGRTPTYLEFQIIFDIESGEEILRVRYSEHSLPEYIEYRKSKPGRKNPEERRGDGFGTCTWLPLAYDNQNRTFASISNCYSAVPSKVSSWLLGKPMPAMVSIKAYTPKPSRASSSCKKVNWKKKPSPGYERLHENTDGTLQVYYTDHGWFSYRRSNVGGFGTEQRENEVCPLIYSEVLHTLKSDILKAPLPNKVTEWIHQQKCLANIVSQNTTQSDHALARTIDMNPELYWPPDDESVTWTYEKRQFMYWVQSLSDSVIFMETDVTSQVSQELTYSETVKTWLSPTMSGLKREAEWQPGVLVPYEVVRWMKQQSKMHTRYASVRKQYLLKPWCKMTHYVKGMIPKISELNELQTVLDHTFENPMLLLEAITHASYAEAQTPSNQSLALLGGKVADMLLTQAIIDRTKFPMHSTQRADEEGEGKQMDQTYAVVGLQGKTLEWPKVQAAQDDASSDECGSPERHDDRKSQGRQSALKSSDQILEWINACCNHIMYSYVCYLKKIHKHILHDSEELQAAIRHFTKIARAASKSPQTMWKTLSSYDAPRVLSDTLLAIVAAVFLDSDWSKCTQWFTAHIFDKNVFDKYIFDASMVKPNGGPTSSGDPVSHLKGIAAKAGLPLALRQIPAPACRNAFAGPNVKDAMTSTLHQTTMDASRGRAFCANALAPVTDKSVEKEKRGERAWDHQEKVAFGLRDFNYCTLWVGGHRVGPAVGSVSPRSALRRGANLALGGDSDRQTLQALQAAKTTLDSAKTMEDAGDDLRRSLVEMKILESASVHRNSSAEADGEEKDAAEGKQFIVRCPVGTWPMLLHNATEGELSDESDGRNGHMGAGATMPENKYCECCQVHVNGPVQWNQHIDGKIHKKKQAAANKKDKGQSEKANRQKSNPEISASIAAEIQHEDEEDIKNISEAPKATGRNISTTAVTNSSSAASSGSASQQRTHPMDGSEDWASSPPQYRHSSIIRGGQHDRPYVLWPAGFYPGQIPPDATHLSDGFYDWVAVPIRTNLVFVQPD